MNRIEDRFKDAAATAMPPSRLSADEVYAGAFRRRRRRVATWAAAGLVAALVLAVVGIDTLRSPGDDRVAGDPTHTEETQPWLRDGAVTSAVATDATHVYAVTSVCPPDRVCSYRLLGSDDAGATWTVRRENVPRDVYAPAAGVLHQPDREAISTDGGRTWVDLRRVTTPVDAVPAGGWLESADPDLLVFDPATATVAPLRNRPGFQVVRVREVPPAVGFWLTVWDAARKRLLLATTPDRGRTWTTADADVSAPATVDGVTGYDIVSGPAGTRIHRTADGGSTWQRVPSEGPLPDDRAFTVVQGYVARDGTHVVLMDLDQAAQPHPERFQVFTSDDDGRTYGPGGVTGLAGRLSRDSRSDAVVRTEVAGVYLAHDDGSVFVSTDGLTWTGHPVG